MEVPFNAPKFILNILHVLLGIPARELKKSKNPKRTDSPASRLGTQFLRKWGRGGRGVRERALGSPTHSLAHRGGAWRLAAQGGKGELYTALAMASIGLSMRFAIVRPGATPPLHAPPPPPLPDVCG
jgi:hypothetical protein